jgi:hypothetical protein
MAMVRIKNSPGKPVHTSACDARFISLKTVSMHSNVVLAPSITQASSQSEQQGRKIAVLKDVITPHQSELEQICASPSETLDGIF